MTQQSGNQFDDDLTVGMDDVSYETDSIDLFEFTGDEESPIARLKTIILSIDWEINDDILQQLDDELVDLGDIWAGDKIKLVYVQGLSKIGRYIFKEKANAHPNAIKLLITFYHNLEKIVSSDDLMSAEEKKQLLLKDVKMFDQLKKQIGISDSGAMSVDAISTEEETEETDHLKALKAYVLGLDWEINDEELQKLDDEIHRLEGVFSQNKAKLILLQGLGAFSSYINKMRSQSNSKVFTLLHSFYGTLEIITESNLPADEQKQLLFSEVEKFNAFKLDIAAAQSEPAEVVSEAPAEVISEPTPAEDVTTPVTDFVSDDIAPAFADADAVDEEDDTVTSDVESRLNAVFGDEEDEKSSSNAEENIALEGVNVETDADDDSDEEALPYEGDTVAPALSDVDEDSSFSVEKLAGDLAQSIELDDQDDDDLMSDSILQGVDVETEADDDSDEESLPFDGDELAPALSGSFEDSGLDEDILADGLEESDSEGIENRLDSFFDDEVQASSDEWGAEKEGIDDSILQGVEVETEADDDSDEESLPFDGDELAPALSGSPEDSGFNEDILTDELDESDSEGIESRLDSFFDDEVQASSDEWGADEENDLQGFTDGAPAPALSDNEELLTDEVVLEEAIEDQLSFFDEESSAPAIDTSTEQLQEDASVQETVADKLSFLDEDIEDTHVPKSEDEDLSLFEDDAHPPALSDDIELASIDDAVDDELSVLEEETDIPVIDETEELSVEKDTEEALDLFDEDVPGLEFGEPDESGDGVSVDSEKLPDIEEIEFSVPGETATVAVAAATMAAVVGKEEAESEAPVGFEVPAEESESEEVIFEAVDDDVEVDPLPGEEYIPLGKAIISLQENNSGNELQSLFAEINRSRNLNPSNNLGKIFLQLLSTICQHVERNMDDFDGDGLSLMDEVYSGLRMSSSPVVSTDQVHQNLLTCTSKVLFLQEQDIRRI